MEILTGYQAGPLLKDRGEQLLGRARVRRRLEHHAIAAPQVGAQHFTRRHYE